MARYILIDNCSGYIFADSADLGNAIWTGETPMDFARAFDVSIGETDRDYEECGRRELASNEAGYHVYRADDGGSDAVTVVTDGQHQEMIEAVERDCRYVTTLRAIRAGA